MTDNKEPIWITIPEESSSLSADETAKPKSKKRNIEKVENKFFWGIGLIALLVFTAILLAPQQFAGVLKAQLFDSYQVVPDYSDQDETFPENTEESVTADAEVPSGEALPVSDAEILPEPESNAVVEAEADAVTIQIEPITEAEEFSVEPIDSVETVSEAEIIDEAEAKSEISDAVDSSESEFDGLGVSPDLQTLLIGLSSQLEELKEDVRQKDQDISDLTTLLQDQAIGLYGAAPLTAITSPIVGTTVDGITTPAPVTIPSAGSQILTQGGGVYRYNTHTITTSPYDILAQNQLATAPFQTQIAANVQGAVLPYSNQNFNSVLSKVREQPETGPGEIMLFTLLLSSIGILAWGSMRAVRVD